MKRTAQLIIALAIVVGVASSALANRAGIWQGLPQRGGRQYVSLKTALQAQTIHLGPRESSLTIRAPLGTKLTVYSPQGNGPEVQGVLNAAGTHLLYRLRMGSYTVQDPTGAKNFSLVMPMYLRATGR